MVVNAGRPTLLIPHQGEFSNLGKHVVIAWDGSREAACAISDALPLLHQSNTVQVLILNPGEDAEAHGEEPGADIALTSRAMVLKSKFVFASSKKETGGGNSATCSRIGG